MRPPKKRKIWGFLSLLLAGLLLAGCASAAQGGSGAPSSAVVSSASVPADDGSSTGAGDASVDTSSPGGVPAAPSVAGSSAAPEAERPACFFDELADGIIAGLALPEDAADTDRVLAAYRAVIARTVYIEFDDERLTESWRTLDHCGHAPTVYQTTALGPLYYGIGTCEHFSAALMVLLERMGYPTRYVAGRTWSYDGRLVDHAWVMVCLDEVWYHIDPQLEDNVIRDGRIEYRYFLKGDAAFLAHHVWGDALPVPDEHALALPECPQAAPPPELGTIVQAPAPDMDALIRQADRQRQTAAGPPTRLEPVGSLPPLPRYVEKAAGYTG